MLTEDCGRGFKLKAINHKVNSCQTYIRHFSRFGILAKVFIREFQVSRFFLLKLLGTTKLSEPYHSVVLLAVLLPLAHA